jgi:ubiquinone/menaquinone biosynthesis C-methylase UbiE
MYKTKNKHQFLDPSQILAYAALRKGDILADFGCGNGFYPIAAAKTVGATGMVYAVDVKNEALEATASAAKMENLKNIYTIRHDLEQPTATSIKENSCDAVILSGILHLSKLQNNIMRETYRVLKSGGKVIVIEWKKEKLPFGPEINNRVSEKDVEQMMSSTGFHFQNEIPADTFHYALVFTK